MLLDMYTVLVCLLYYAIRRITLPSSSRPAKACQLLRVRLERGDYLNSRHLESRMRTCSETGEELRRTIELMNLRKINRSEHHSIRSLYSP